MLSVCPAASDVSREECGILGDDVTEVWYYD